MIAGCDAYSGGRCKCTLQHNNCSQAEMQRTGTAAFCSPTRWNTHLFYLRFDGPLLVAEAAKVCFLRLLLLLLGEAPGWASTEWRNWPWQGAQPGMLPVGLHACMLLHASCLHGIYMLLLSQAPSVFY